MEVEITELPELTREQAALLDMHSAVNVMNVLLNELGMEQAETAGCSTRESTTSVVENRNRVQIAEPGLGGLIHKSSLYAETAAASRQQIQECLFSAHIKEDSLVVDDVSV